MDEEFKRLTLAFKVDFLINYGEYISEIKYYGFLVELYILEGHYIEMFYNIHSREVEEVELLDPMERRLALYAIDVDISSIFNA